jgi:hypothetical protein
MADTFEVERLDQASASSLIERLTKEFETRAEVCGDRPCCVRLELEPALIGDLLHVLEEWTRRSGKDSLSVRLNGHSYILECREEEESRSTP